MPRVSTSRLIAVPREKVWALISDPHHFPRWWPLVMRVENIRGQPGAKRAQWTAVLQSDRGNIVRADYRCVGSTRPERYAWEQELEGTPFERILRASVVEATLRPADGGTEVKLASRNSLRGLSRLGSPMMRRATHRRLDEALDGIALALEEERGD